MEKNYDQFDALFIDVYDKNYVFLVKYLFFLVNDFGIAEDLAHDIFLRVYSSKNINIDSSRFRSYIKKAAKNIAIDYIKKSVRFEARHKKIITVLKKFDETIYSDLESCKIEGEVISTVHDVLDEFPEKNRKIFISRIVEEKPRKQVSEEEKLSAYNVKKIEEEIICILREKLKHLL